MSADLCPIGAFWAQKRACAQCPRTTCMGTGSTTIGSMRHLLTSATRPLLDPSAPAPSSARAHTVRVVSVLAAKVFHPALWSTCATIIPVLMIALLFQERYFDHDDEETADDSIYLIGVAVAMIGAEAVSMYTLGQSKTPSLAARVLVGAGIELPILILAVRMIRPRFEAFERTLSPGLQLGIQSGLLLCVVVFSVATFAGLSTGEWPSYFALAIVLFAFVRPRKRIRTKQTVD